MRGRLLRTPSHDPRKAGTALQGSLNLQVVLWTLWTLVVLGIGYANGHADVIAERPATTLGLVIHCLVAGVIGLVVMTIVEIHLELWRYLDTEE
jgi:hypothetical protein